MRRYLALLSNLVVMGVLTHVLTPDGPYQLSLITAALFTVGKYLIGLYIGKSAVASDFGAAGTLVVVIMWVYYSSQIFFLGAEFTRAYSLHHGSKTGDAANSDFGSSDEDGFNVQALVRSALMPSFELEGGLDYVDFGGNNGDTTSLVGAGRYFFTQAFAGGLNVKLNDDAKSYGVDFRFNFK